MIPKIIHYVWFGGKKMPPKIEKCIQSWKKHLPEYQFMLWNESTFPPSKMPPFALEALQNKQYAFVSDYIRFHVLAEYGGIYLDTDVEVLKHFDDSFLAHPISLVLDNNGYISGSTIFSEPDNPFIKDCIRHYHSIPFIKKDGKMNNQVINTHMQDKLRPCGYQIENKFQKITFKNSDIILYPDDFFHVRSLDDGSLNLTENSYAIHWHTILWVSTKTKLINFLRIHILTKVLGTDRYAKITSKIKKGKSTF